jgi:hypothetical protein
MDSIFRSWLTCQLAEATKLAADSDILTLCPGTGAPPQDYLARFESPTLVREGGAITQRTGFEVLVHFPPDYLRSVPHPMRVVALLTPRTTYHPNVSSPFVCLGNIAPGTSLCELLFQAYEMLTFNKLTPREDDALNRDACAWARGHMGLFPLTSRPLLRRVASLNIEEVAPGGSQ